MKISMEIITTVEFQIAADKYPAGMSPDVALALEIEQASQDPHEYVAMHGCNPRILKAENSPIT